MKKLDEQLAKTLGKAVKNQRKRQEMNQEALAFHAGVATSVISRIELGKSQSTFQTICDIAKALDNCQSLRH